VTTYHWNWLALATGPCFFTTAAMLWPLRQHGGAAISDLLLDPACSSKARSRSWTTAASGSPASRALSSRMPMPTCMIKWCCLMIIIIINHSVSRQSAPSSLFLVTLSYYSRAPAQYQPTHNEHHKVLLMPGRECRYDGLGPLLVWRSQPQRPQVSPATHDSSSGLSAYECGRRAFRLRSHTVALHHKRVFVRHDAACGRLLPPPWLLQHAI